MGAADCRATFFLLMAVAAAAATFFPMLLLHSAVPLGHGRRTSSNSAASCASRSQSPLLFPPNRRSSFRQSSSFSSAWRRYERLHRSCTSSKDLTSSFSSSDDDNDPCHYLVYLETHAGLGNRLLSLASAFTYALLTDRVLLIDRRQNLGSLLCEPFEASSWLLPDDFPYATIDNSSTLADIDLDHLPSPSVDVNISGAPPRPRFLRLHLQHVRRRRDERFFCEDAQSFLASSVKWVGWSSNQYYVTELFAMPMFFRRLHDMFPMSSGGGTNGSYVDGVFTTLSRLLFLPSDGVWDIVLQHYDAYLADARSRVGVQVRLHGHRKIAGFEPLVSQKIQECLNFAGALPETTEAAAAAAAAAPRTAEEGEQRDGQAKVAVLVASLNGEYARDLGRKYSNVTWVRVHTASEMAAQGNTEEEVRMALAEMWLLSFSDILATSAFSTFGYVAQGIGGIRPYILKFGKDTEDGGGATAAPPCALADSAEPCTHFPVILRCAGGLEAITADHSAWIGAHMRPCSDHSTGWQIVRTSAASPPLVYA